MIGLPGETLDNALETVELNMVLKSDYVRAKHVPPFPGSAARRVLAPEGVHRQRLRHRQADCDLAGDHAENAVRSRVPQTIASLFWLMVKCPPSWMPLLRWVVGMPDNLLFRVIGSFNMVQELLFYRVRPIPALRYFKNTVLMTGKSGLTMTMRTIPRLFRKKADVALGHKQIYEAGRGYF